MTELGGWEAVRDAVRRRVGASAYQAWFAAVGGRVEADRLVVQCPDRFSREWIRARYGSLLQEVAGGLLIEWEVGAQAEARRGPARAAPVTASVASPAPSFEGFVAGPNNALALEAARAIARGGAGRCSPLVIVGDSGVGKTHLCRAIAAATREGALYRSAEEFTTEVTQALRAGQMAAIRQRYRRSSNVLILEDVQFLEGKRATQVELFHTLDHLLARECAVVLSANRVPHELSGLDPALRSRMTSGLVARIAAPEVDTRRAILRDRAAAGGVRLPEACLETLASRPVRSVRDLVAGLNQVIAHATLLRRPITPELVATALSDVEVSAPAHTLEQILELVASAYGLSRADLSRRSRERRLARPRQIAMYLCRRYTDASLAEIGRALGRDHTSVLHATRAVEARIAERPQLRYELEALARRVTSER